MAVNRKWWKESVVYQIYPRSFKDTNQDGIGDLNGITEKIPYIKQLGIDIIWICPIFLSPNFDNGYDISDYRRINPEFGTMGDFEQLLNTAHQFGLKVILDLVANHSSDQHPWFLSARQSEDSPHRDYYYWKKGTKNSIPNNWPSFFRGNVWEYEDSTDAYYLHLFSKYQPDLNWENPKLREEIYDIMRYWLDKGIDGFRMDVITTISKDLTFKDTNLSDFNQIVCEVFANGPKVHNYIGEMYEKVLQNYDIMTIGEGTGILPHQANLYVGKSRNELNMVFHFDHMFIDNGPDGKYDPVDWDLATFKQVFQTWDNALGEEGWNSIFLGNHDFPRIVSRFGDDGEYRIPSAKLLATLLLTMKGTVFIYQGDELGMTNVRYESINDYNDIETINSFNEGLQKEKDPKAMMEIVYDQSRDNARTPMQWNSSANAGFSEIAPWLKLNGNYTEVNVELSEADPFSILNYYRKMIQLRKSNPALVYGSYHPLDLPEHPTMFVYQRRYEDQKWWVVLNFGGEQEEISGLPREINFDNLLLSNYVSAKIVSEKLIVRPWEALIFKKGNNE